MEIWKDIKGYEGRYQVSNMGRVKSLKRIESFDKSCYSSRNKFGILGLENYKNKYFVASFIKNKKHIYKCFSIKKIGYDNAKALATKYIEDNSPKLQYQPIKEKILKLNKSRDGYFRIDLITGNKTRYLRVSRIVASEFLVNEENKPCVNHKNGIKCDNRVYNLEWVTYKENTQHAIKTGLIKRKSKRVLCITTNTEFFSRFKAAEWLNEYKFKNSRLIRTLVSGIAACCNGSQKTAYNFKWKYLD